MQTVTAHLRAHLEGQIRPDGGRRLPPLSEMQQTEWSPRFEQLMRNRLLMGAFRYERLGDKRPGEYALLESIEKRLAAYRVDGNLEHLVDAANLCLIEFEYPSIAGASLRPVDDGEHTKKVNR